MNKGKDKTYTLVNFMRNNNFAVFHQRPLVNVGDKIKKGDVLADTSSTVGGQIALGQKYFCGIPLMVRCKHI